MIPNFSLSHRIFSSYQGTELELAILNSSRIEQSFEPYRMQKIPGKCIKQILVSTFVTVLIAISTAISQHMSRSALFCVAQCF